mmetsp:Transcript_47228/g.156544  ORF Transcript_47228/g.156544 Transcript_47228/m.156544 type:complete len:326 (+) Transcript_47228:959-1936(+)
MVAKCGNRLRIDGSLTGLDADAKSLLPRWKRGSVSVLLAPPPAGSSAASKPDPRVALVSHDQKTFKWLGRILKQAKEELAVPCEPRAKQTVEDAEFERLVLRGVRGTQSATRPDAPRFRPLLDWRGAPKSERVSGVRTVVHEAQTRLRTAHTTKRNVAGPHAYALSGSFLGYVAARGRDFSDGVRSELMQVPMTYDDLMKSVGMRQRGDAEQEGSTLRARVWLAHDSPLNVEHLQLILNLLALINQHASDAAHALGRWPERDAFPMKVNVPLPLSLYAQLVVADVKPAGGAAMPASHFAVPDEYEEMDSAQDVQRLLRPGRAGGR